MKILTRYVLREHLGPLIFALTALTSLLMLQFVARQLGNLVGKGLPWRVIGEFFVLSLPFTVAMTLPMAVLVATLHAFGRMATENEITAFKASGVRVTTLMFPVVIGAAVLALGMVAFNDQVLPRANHRLRVLQQDMARTKPTFALSEQTLNQVTTGFYMRVGKLDRASNKMKEVTIYDLSAPFDRKTIYADSGDLSFTPDKKDLQLVLFDGYQQQLEGATKHTLRRSYFRSQAVRVKQVGGEFEQTGNDDWRGDREKSICEMQSEYVVDAREYERVRQIYIETARKSAKPGQKTVTVPKPRPATEGLARLYCNGLALVFRTQTAVPSITPLPQQAVSATGSPPPSAGGAIAATNPAAGVPGAAAVPGAPVQTSTITPAMQRQLDSVQASIDATRNPIDSGAIKVAAQIRAQAAAEQLAYNKRSMVTDTGKGQVVAAGTKPDSGAPKSVAAGGAAPPLPVSVANGGSAPPLPATAQAQTVAAAQPPVATPPVTATTPPSTPPGTPPSTPPVGAPVVVAPPATNATTVPPAVVPGIVSANGVVANPNGAVPAAQTPAVPVSSVPVGAPASSSTNIDPTLGGLINEGGQAALNAANSQLSLVRGSMDSLAVEIQKKFALSFACIVFVLFGPPIALRFPRGGVGATLGVSLVVFGAYYVCLMAGETLADAGKLPPFVAMWIANVIFTLAGLLLLISIEKTADASRGGGLRAWFEERRARRSRRAVRVAQPTVAV